MEEKDVLVQVEGVSKKFCKDLKRSLWYGLQALNPLSNSNHSELRKDEFWAVKDVSFELRRGECLGLIGHNGAGKSTLLKMLNGLVKPDEGKIAIHGKVGALIELGAGFNPILTGRENIFNNGAVLGFTKEEIDAKVEDIIDFAEIREFIDMPVQNYSSGMKVRLGFAIAAQMEPDVLIIDEVLAVGDLGFVLKCFKTIDLILPNTAVIFVSHNMPLVSRICNQIILMEKGNSNFQGNKVGTAIDLYYKRFSQNESTVVFDGGSVEISKVYIKGFENKMIVPTIEWKDDLRIIFELNLLKKLDCVFNITIFDKEQRPIAVMKKNTGKEIGLNNEGKLTFELVHNEQQLSKGIYSINIAVYNRKTNEPLLRVNNLTSFQVIYEENVWQPFMLDAKYSKI